MSKVKHKVVRHKLTAEQIAERSEHLEQLIILSQMVINNCQWFSKKDYPIDKIQVHVNNLSANLCRAITNINHILMFFESEPEANLAIRRVMNSDEICQLDDLLRVAKKFANIDEITKSITKSLVDDMEVQVERVPEATC